MQIEAKLLVLEEVDLCLCISPLIDVGADLHDHDGQHSLSLENSSLASKQVMIGRRSSMPLCTAIPHAMPRSVSIGE